jgi:hypothetical protein
LDRYSVVLFRDSCSFLLTSSEAARTATRRAGTGATARKTQTDRGVDHRRNQLLSARAVSY